MKPKRLMSGLFILMLSAMLLTLGALPAAAIGDYQVIGYNKGGFKGKTISWTLPKKGYRHLRILKIDMPRGEIISLKLGAKVKVMTFTKPNLYSNKALDYIFVNDRAGISGGARSLIIFPASQQYPKGAYIRATYDTGNFSGTESKFFPVPDKEGSTWTCFIDEKFFGRITKFAVYGKGVFAKLNKEWSCGGTEVDFGGKYGAPHEVNIYDPKKPPLNAFHGKIRSLRVGVVKGYEYLATPLPKPAKTVTGAKPLEQNLNKAQLIPSIHGDWQSSINLRHQIVQFKDKTKGKIRTVPQVSPIADFTLNGRDLVAVFTNDKGQKEVVKGRITQMFKNGYALRIEWDNKVILYRTAKVKKPGDTVPPGQVNLKAPDVSGTWKSSIGLEYVFMQNQNQLTWQVKQHNETGQGGITGRKIQASWSGEKGKGSGSAEITKVDAANKALEIKWNNGVLFYR
jgi:hypothetical protein